MAAPNLIPVLLWNRVPLLETPRFLCYTAEVRSGLRFEAVRSQKQLVPYFGSFSELLLWPGKGRGPDGKGFAVITALGRLEPGMGSGAGKGEKRPRETLATLTVSNTRFGWPLWETQANKRCFQKHFERDLIKKKLPTTEFQKSAEARLKRLKLQPDRPEPLLLTP